MGLSILRLIRYGLFALVIGCCVGVEDACAQPIKARIIDGTNTSEASFPYVARLSSSRGTLCSGTLITSRHILTAAHCFYVGSTRRVIGDTDYLARLNGKSYRSLRVAIHPTYRSRGGACVEGEVDAAIIELSEEVAVISPIPLRSSPVPVGSSVLLVGYGYQGSGSSGQNGQLPPLGSVNYGFTVVEGYGDQAGEQDINSLYFSWRFESGESNTASGDSGGPAFYDVAGERYLAGMTCGGTGNAEFFTYSFNTRADRLRSWVDEITGQAPPVLSISRAALRYNERATDMLTISGKTFVGKSFAPRGRSAVLKIGSYQQSFRLDSLGRSAVTDRGYLRLRGTQRRNRYVRPVVQFEAMIKQSTLFRLLPGLGFEVSSEAFGGESHVLPVTLRINGYQLSALPVLSFRNGEAQWLIVRP